MCGIVGIHNRDGRPVSAADLHRATTLLAHRGPDDSGYVLIDTISNQATEAADEATIAAVRGRVDRVETLNGRHDLGFGHHRLSIIDLSPGGHQPMADAKRQHWITYNGEIYNFAEIREELESFGHSFRTSSDTEVLLAAYRQWGPGFLAGLNGIFAFALWDGERKGLLLARDHLGVKPLYYRLDDTRCIFASEIKAILQICGQEAEVDPRGIDTLLTFRYVPSPDTLFRGVKKVEPGTALWIQGDRHEVIEYWTTAGNGGGGSGSAPPAEEYLEHLERTVKRQLVGDVPVGILLSSGVDSSAVLRLMARHCSGTIHAFTADFEESRDNEGDRAARFAREVGAEHHRVVVSPADYQDFFDRYLWHLEEPVGNESALANYFVSELAASKVKVVLAGQGADEPWAGYPRYRGLALSRWYRSTPAWIRRHLVQPAIRALPRAERLKRGAASLGEEDELARFVAVYTIFDRDRKALLYNDRLRPYLDDGRDNPRLSKLLSRGAPFDSLGRMLFVDTRMWLPDDLLLVGDKLSMAHSLEVRVPYLDPRLIEFIETLPSRQKLRYGRGKYLHRKALASLVPGRILDAKKLGFANPVDVWFRTRAEIVKETLLDPGSPCTEFFRREAIETLLSEHASGRENHMRKIFLLYSFAAWRRTFSGSIQGPVASS